LKKIVFFTLSPIPYGDNITDGSGFRIWGMANQLKKNYSVTIVTLYNSYIRGVNNYNSIFQDDLIINEISYKPSNVSKKLKEIHPDILIFSNWSSYVFASWFKSDIPVVMDYVGPSLMENLMFQRTNTNVLSRLKLHSFEVADCMITTTERLRYYLIGCMTKSSRLRRYTEGDPIVNVIPIFPPPNPLTKADKDLKSLRDDQDFTILLPGAIVPWYDYKTVLLALSKLKKVGKKFKLVVMGDASPSLSWSAGTGILQISRDLGLSEDVEVTGLVPFNQRKLYYLNADIAIIPNKNTLENDLAARVRVIDCFWGNLPMVTPGGDEYSEIAIRDGCAFRYSFNDSESLVKLLLKLIENRDALDVARANISIILSKEFNAEKLTKSLIKYIDESKHHGNRNSLFSITKGFGPYLRNFVSPQKGR
jgi:glycosyltransferase involved in cell wall biosynthesis